MASPAPQPSGRKAHGQRPAENVTVLRRERERRGRAPSAADVRQGRLARQVASERKREREARASATREQLANSLRQRQTRRAEGYKSIDTEMAGLREKPASKSSPAPQRPGEQYSKAQGINPNVEQEAPLQRRTVGKREKPANTAPRRPVQVQIVPGQKQPGPGTPSATVLLTLGLGLAAVATWHTWIVPAFDTAWNGNNAKHKFSLPATSAMAMLGFILLLLLLANISDAWARAVFWFLLALWAVYLLLSPDQPLTFLANAVNPSGGSEPGGKVPPSGGSGSGVGTGEPLKVGG